MAKAPSSEGGNYSPSAKAQEPSPNFCLLKGLRGSGAGDCTASALPTPNPDTGLEIWQAISTGICELQGKAQRY